jgi:prepilin-type N-terminal cleavage/methylation domain-containing protein
MTACFNAETRRHGAKHGENISIAFLRVESPPLCVRALKKSGGSRGVTLIEMVVVVAIIGLMIAISFPTITAGLDSVRMSSATGSVAAFLNAAENRAERRQQPIALVISPKDNLLAMYGNEPGSDRRLQLPQGVSIQAVLPVIDGETPDQPRQWILMPGGTAPGMGILLANARGIRRMVRLDPMTGFPRVESVPNR